MLHKDLIRHGMEFVRAISNHQYEVSPTGIHFPKQHAIVQGQFDTWINGADHQVDPNVVPIEALNYLLKAGINVLGGISSWYIAPFRANTAPTSALTAALFTSTQNEFTAYVETTRQAWTVPVDPVAGVFTNAAAPAVFTADSTVGTGAGIDIYGAAVLGASAKSATSSKLLTAALFGGARNVKTPDKLTVQYSLSATSV